VEEKYACFFIQLRFVSDDVRKLSSSDGERKYNDDGATSEVMIMMRETEPHGEGRSGYVEGRFIGDGDTRFSVGVRIIRLFRLGNVRWYQHIIFPDLIQGTPFEELRVAFSLVTPSLNEENLVRPVKSIL
jgi:hypothetical protein